MVGTAVALSVISSSKKVSPDFEEYLSSTVIGKDININFPINLITNCLQMQRGPGLT